LQKKYIDIKVSKLSGELLLSDQRLRQEVLKNWERTGYKNGDIESVQFSHFEEIEY
jgi:hypothetical protein